MAIQPGFGYQNPNPFILIHPGPPSQIAPFIA